MPAGQDVEAESPSRDRCERFADKLFRAKFDELRPASADTTAPVSTAKSIENKPEVNQRMTKRALLKDYCVEMDRLRQDLVSSVFIPSSLLPRCFISASFNTLVLCTVHKELYTD